MMKKFQSWFSKVKATVKPPKQPQYAQPTYTRTILSYIARGVLCLDLGGWNEDAAAFKEFCSDIFDADQVDQAFTAEYEIEPGRTEDEFFADAQVFLKLAGVALADQKKRHGEDNWDLFIDQIKLMKARERERRRSRRVMVEVTETDLDRIRRGDEGVVENVTREARWLWENWYAAKRSGADEGIDESLEALNRDWRMDSDIS